VRKGWFTRGTSQQADVTLERGKPRFASIRHDIPRRRIHASSTTHDNIDTCWQPFSLPEPELVLPTRE
jgi:hypothetical protein